MSVTNTKQVADSDPVRPFSCPEPGCSKRYATSRGVTDHKRTKHGPPQAFHCNRPNCSKSYPLKKTLDRHITQIHDRRMPRETYSIIMADARNVLKSSPTYKCPCDQSTTRSVESVREHLLLNTSQEFVETHRLIARELELSEQAARRVTIEDWEEELAEIEASLADFPDVLEDPIILDDGTRIYMTQQQADLAAANDQVNSMEE